jgi:hypothetical protein
MVSNWLRIKIKYRGILNDFLGFTATFALLLTTRPLGPSNLSHHLKIPPILQTILLFLFQRSVAKINMMTLGYAYKAAL